MQIVSKLVVLTAAAGAALMLGAAPAAHAQGSAPTPETCKAHPTDPVIQGGCIVINRKKGNCMACHEIAGTSYGNIAPPLKFMKQRFPDKAALHAQIWDPTVRNPHTSMPPFGKNGILTNEEIDKVVDFIQTL